MSKHFALPASELETALRNKAPPPVKAAPKPAAPKVPEGPPPDQLEASWMAAVLKDRRLLAKDEHRVRDELKHLGLRHIVAAIQSGGTPEDALYEAGEATKSALTKSRDLLPADESSLEQAFTSVCKRLKLRAIDDRLAFIARETANTLGGTSELTQDSRDLLTERGELLTLKRKLLSQK
jgi:DNA primase